MTKKTAGTRGAERPPSPLLSVRLDDERLHRHLARVVDRTRTVHDEPVERSVYVRDLLRSDAEMWLHSPYVVARSSNFLLVTRSGDFVFYRQEELRLNQKNVTVSADIAMKHDKIAYYLDDRELIRARRKVGTIQDAWLLNVFVCKTPDNRLYPRMDPNGLTSKSVDFPTGLAKGCTVGLDTVVVLRDYAQYAGEGHGAPRRPSESSPPAPLEIDEAYVDVQVPTELLELIVVLDQDLYRDDDTYGGEHRPPLEFVMKNTRGASFTKTSQPEKSHGFDHDFLWRLGSRVLPDGEDDEGEGADEKYRASLGTARQRVSDIAAALQGYQGRLQEQETSAERDRLLAQIQGVLGRRDELLYFPEKAYFYHVKHAHCMMGLRLSVSWAKPGRAR